jgi:4-methylaminobutanoate oxidase (formaldehyde-forming)
LTVARLGENYFRLITGSSQAIHDADWIRRNLRGDERISLTDVTEMYCVIGVMGPNSRSLLNRVSNADFSNDAFPFGTSHEIEIGQSSALALRITYVGELGWELHIPTSQAAQSYRLLLDVGKEFGAIQAGHYAINSLRLEKAYRAWGADISPDDTPLEAGLGFAVAWDKPDFIGKQSLLEQRSRGLKRMLVTFVLRDPAPVLWGSEPILRDDVAVGYTTSGSYAHSLGAGIGMGYVKNADGVNSDWVRVGRYEININGQRYEATPFLRSPYDPERKKILS